MKEIISRIENGERREAVVFSISNFVLGLAVLDCHKFQPVGRGVSSDSKKRKLFAGSQIHISICLGRITIYMDCTFMKYFY